MGKYGNVLGLMKDTGHTASNGHGRGYRSFKFTPARLVGIAVHALVSGRPWEDYLTDSNKIYVPKNGAQRFDGSKRHKEDIVREDLVLRIINAAPSSVHDDFESVDGHLRVSDFSYAFGGRNEPGSYLDFLGELDESKRFPAALVRQDEARHIRRRLSRNHHHVARLLEAMRKDEEPMPEFAGRLEKALVEYGYNAAGCDR